MWSANPKDGENGGVERPKKGSGDVILESMLFKDDAKEIGVVEVRNPLTSHASTCTIDACPRFVRWRLRRSRVMWVVLVER